MAELVREVFIEASPEVVFQFLVDPAKYVEWGGSEAVLDPRPGGTYRALMGGTCYTVSNLSRKGSPDCEQCA